MRRFFSPTRHLDGRWRILVAENGFERDLCGAETEAVAWEVCVILNAMVRNGRTP